MAKNKIILKAGMVIYNIIAKKYTSKIANINIKKID